MSESFDPDKFEPELQQALFGTRTACAMALEQLPGLARELQFSEYEQLMRTLTPQMLEMRRQAERAHLLLRTAVATARAMKKQAETPSIGMAGLLAEFAPAAT